MAYTAIDNPAAYFNTVLYTGDGVAIGSGGNTITGVGFHADFTWIKRRAGSTDHNSLFDAVRGATQILHSNTTDADSDNNETLTSWNSDGFVLGNVGEVNGDGQTQVAWNWKESATAGFDIVVMEGTGSARTQAHSLSAIPHFMVVKSIDDADNWFVYHHQNTAAPETDKLKLDETAATADDNTIWNDTAPTSSVFTVGTTNGVNKDDSDFVAYLWAEKQGFSKFSKYTGFGNAENVFVYCGFRPAFILLKQSSGAGEDWIIYDEHREPYNGDVNRLRASANSVESSDSYIDITSTGFKCRTTDGTVSGNGDVHIFMAFADSPIVNSEGVPNNAR